MWANLRGEGSSNMKIADQENPKEVERRMQAGLVKALHTSAKPHSPAKSEQVESQSK
jgi:hypothetical protein